MSERFERIITYGACPVTFSAPATWTEEVKDLYERLKSRDYSAVAPLLEADFEFLLSKEVFIAIACLKSSAQVNDEFARAELEKIGRIIMRRPGQRKKKVPYGDRLKVEADSLVRLIEENGLLEVREDQEKLQERAEALFGLISPASQAMYDGNLTDQEKARIMFGLRSSVPTKPKPKPDLVPEADDEEVRTLSPEECIAREWDLMKEKAQQNVELVRKLGDADSYRRVVKAICVGVKAGKKEVKTAKSWAINILGLLYGVEAKKISERIAKEIKAKRRNWPSPSQENNAKRRSWPSPSEPA